MLWSINFPMDSCCRLWNAPDKLEPPKGRYRCISRSLSQEGGANIDKRVVAIENDKVSFVNGLFTC